MIYGQKCFLPASASDSPVVFRLEVANRYEASSTAHRKLVLQWRPLHKRGGAVDPEDDESRLPHAVLLAPHVSVAIRSTGYDPIAFRSPVDALTHTQNILQQAFANQDGVITHNDSDYL